MKKYCHSQAVGIKVLIQTLLLLITFFATSCEEGYLNPALQPYFHNHPLPRYKDSLRILAIGNSYTEDGISYISIITKGLNIPSDSYCVYGLTQGGASLSYWNDRLQRNDSVQIHRFAGNRKMELTQSTMKGILHQDWDIIVLQQVSNEAIDYQTYNPPLRHLINACRFYSTNPFVCLAWQLIPAYSTSYPNAKGLVGIDRWRSIAEATQTMIKRDGIDIIIPTGTAIQIARNSPLEDAYELSRDGVHLGYGIGRYIAASTWVQTLFYPVYRKHIGQCTVNYDLTAKEKEDDYEGFIPQSSTPVTDDNRELCLQCATQACLHPFSLTPAATE